MKFSYILAAGLLIASMGSLELVAKCCGSSCSNSCKCTKCNCTPCKC